MKKRNRWIALLLGILMVLTFIPTIAFADDDDDAENGPYSADYYYDEQPAILVCPDGENVDFIPDITNDYVIVHKDGVDVKFVYDLEWNEYSEEYDYVLKNAKPSDNNYVDNASYWYVSPTEIQIEIVCYSIDNDYNRNYWGAIANLKDVRVYNEVKKIEFIPTSTTMYSEDIVNTYVDEDDGKTYTYLDLWKRSKHSKEGQTWYSRFAKGDKLIVYYDDNRTKTFINDDYYDEEDNMWYDEFRCGNEYIYVWMQLVADDLKAGNNEVEVEYHAVTTKTTFIVETPESRAAEAKAKAEAEARAKATALAAASNINKATVSASDIKKASDLGATSVTLGANVKKIKKNAFKGTNITTVEVKTKKLKAKSVKGSLKGSSVKTIKVNVGKAKDNKKYKKAYKKIFTKKNAGKKASVK